MFLEVMEISMCKCNLIRGLRCGHVRKQNKTLILILAIIQTIHILVTPRFRKNIPPLTILYHAKEGYSGQHIASYERRTMGRFGVILSNMQLSSCIMFGCSIFPWYGI